MRYTVEVVKDVLSAEGVESPDALVHDSVHGEGLAGTGLSVGEAGDLGSLEG